MSGFRAGRCTLKTEQSDKKTSKATERRSMQILHIKKAIVEL